MNIDTGVDTITRLHAKDMASRAVDIRVSQENLSKQRVQDIIDIVNAKPNHDGQDLESRNVIYHQIIGLFKELKSRGDLREDKEEVLKNYPHLELYLEDREAYNSTHGNENRIYGSMSWFWRALVWGSIHNSVDNENVVKSYMMGFFKPKEG